MKALLKFVLVLAFSFNLTALSIAEPIQGSGSTFVFPLISKLSRDYLNEISGDNDYTSNDNAISYEPVGSLGGVLRLQNADIDFAASDFSLPPDELKRLGYVQFPITAGAIVAAVNLGPAHKQPLKLPGAVIADIYLGKIQEWNNAAIQVANPDVVLPATKITVVHRRDGSGSTFNWTQYLSMASQEWREKYGTNTLISWPLGTSVEGGSKLAAEIAKTEGAIGYLEFGQAVRSGLTIAIPGNSANAFVAP